MAEVISFTINILKETILYGVIAGLIANFLWHKYSIKFPLVKKFKSIGAKGLWIGKIPYKIKSSKNNYAINLFKVTGKIDIKVYIEHYYYDGNTFINRKINGTGIFNSPVVNVAYQFDTNKTNQSGVFIGRIQGGKTGQVIKGNFTQFIDMEVKHNTDIKLVTESYTLYKIKIPFKKQIKMLFGGTYYKNYQEALKQLNSAKKHS